MKKFYINNWLARAILARGYSTITLGPFVFSKLKALPQRVRNHECVHIRQWAELTMTSAIIVWLLMLIFDISAWWLLIAPFVFYILYCLEWLVKLMKYKGEAYRHISFEREAREAEEDDNYVVNSKYFGWIKMIKK